MNNSFKIAIGVTIGFALWMTIGILRNADMGNANPDVEVATNTNSNTITVEAKTLQAQLVTSYIVSQGSLSPNREVTLKAEIAGKINELISYEGATLSSEEGILQMEIDDRAIRKEQSKITLIEKQRRYEAVVSTREKGFASVTDVDTALVALKMAEVELEKINLEIKKTTIRAPFSGIVEEINVDLGDFVTIGSALATIVDNNPLVVEIYISQEEVEFLDTTLPIRTQLVNGTEKTGEIRFISPRADKATRTYRVEIAIPNPEGLRAGSSATAYVPKEQVKAHYVSAGLLTLNDAGEVGIKTVNFEGLVSFYAITIEFSDRDGMWVSGLPDEVNIITAGQGFAPIGERVIVSLVANKDEITTHQFIEADFIQ